MFVHVTVVVRVAVKTHKVARRKWLIGAHANISSTPALSVQTARVVAACRCAAGCF